jgi:SHS2 domain-containing protein
MKPYEFFEHTADIGLRACGRTQAELFENAARGLYAAMGDFVMAEPLDHRVELNAPSVEELLVDWLRELHFLFDTRRWVFTRFEWRELYPQTLRVTLSGGRADFQKSVLNTELKAVTYHHLKVQQNLDHWEATIVLDV